MSKCESCGAHSRKGEEVHYVNCPDNIILGGRPNIRIRLDDLERCARAAYVYKKMVESGKIYDDHAVAVSDELQEVLELLQVAMWER